MRAHAVGHVISFEPRSESVVQKRSWLVVGGELQLLMMSGEHRTNPKLEDMRAYLAGDLPPRASKHSACILVYRGCLMVFFLFGFSSLWGFSCFLVSHVFFGSGFEDNFDGMERAP